jgi:predicted phage tail protein
MKAPYEDFDHAPTFTSRIEGAGGGLGGGSGKSGSDSQTTPTNDPNSLRSSATAQVVDLLCEGPIQGLIAGGKSIFLNDTAAQNEDGTYNFKGLSWEMRLGLPVQDVLPSFADVEATVGVNVKAQYQVPVARELTDPDLDKVRVTIMVPSLSQTNTQDGSIHGSSVSFSIQIAYADGSFMETGVSGAITGKSMAPYYRSFEIPLPLRAFGPSNPWTIRLRRDSADSTDEYTQNDLYLYSITGIISERFTYPNSAIVGLDVDAQLFGNSIPSRGYEIYGKQISYPSNYDPQLRTYAGIWDGTFSFGYCNNPAWVFYDVL